MQHKWHKEIKAWADGAEIESRYIVDVEFKELKEWGNDCSPFFDDEDKEFRIKPQPKVNEFAHIPYWLCCGSVNPHQHHSFCSEAKAGYPERCRFGTAEEHQKRMEKPPQPKEPQYLYVYKDYGETYLSLDKIEEPTEEIKYIGKIKLEE
jgi:hypothetical protein